MRMLPDVISPKEAHKVETARSRLPPFLTLARGILEKVLIMQQMLHTGKRVVSAAVAAATIAFAAGILGLVQPSTALGASAGDLIKGSLSTVYYYGYDGQRYTFPNEKTYMTWYTDFSDVTTISDSALADITLAGNVVYRGGARWIKIQSDPRVYVVSTDGALHWLESESVATSYAGSDWASFIDDVPDGFWPDYTVGASAMTATAMDGQMWKDGSDYYIAVDGEKRMVSSAGRSANGLQARFFLDGTGIDDSALTAGDDITGAVSSLMDPAQTVTGSSSTTGDVTISESSSTAAAASLPGGANAVEVFSFDVEAGSDDATLDALTLTMTGAGATTNIRNVYLYNGAERLTEARSVNASTREATFSNIGLLVDSGDTATVTVRVEASSSQVAADTFGFSIASAEDVTASGDVDGSFPVAGNIFTFTGSDVGYLDIDKSGSITNPTLGEQDAVIGQFKIATNNESASISTIMVKVDNASDHSDFWLWDGDEPLVEGENTSQDYVLFDLSAEEYEIAEGSSNIFSVSADIGGQGSDTVKVYVDNEVDVEAIGGDFGFGLCVDIGDSYCTGSSALGSYDGASCTSASGDCSYSTIQGGDVTITSSSPNAGDVQVNSQDQVLLNFTITSEEEVTIKDLDIQVAADDDNDGDATDGVETGDADDDGLINSGSEANLKDIKIIDTDTGAVVMGPLELDTTTDDASSETSLTGTAEDALQIIDFTDDWTMDAGETRNLAVTVDIDNGLTANETMLSIFDISGFTAEDANGDTVTNIVPSGDITGNTQTARSAAMTIALASTPGDVTTVDGTDNVLVNAFSVTAGTASDLHVSSVKVSVYADEDNSGTFTAGDVSGADVNDFIESCYLTDSAGNQLGSAKAPISTGLSFTVTDTDWDLSAGATDTLKVYCSFANPSDGTDDNAFAFDLADLSEDVVVQDEDGNDVDPTTDAPNGTTSPTNSVYVQDAGSLAVTASANTPNADFVLTSSTDNHVASYTFTATNEAFEVQTLQFTEEEAESDACGYDGTSATTKLAPTGCTDETGYANNISLVTISYPLEDGTTNEASGAMSGNAVTFTLADGEYLYVPVGAPVDVDVYVDVPLTARDAGGSATSNEEIRLAFSDADNSGTEGFNAYGVGSGTQVTEASSGIADIGDDFFVADGIATFVVRETKPTISISSSSPSGASVPGLAEVLRFNVAASSNESVVLDQVTFKITTTDNAASNWNQCDIDSAVTAALDNSEFSIYNLDKSSSTALDTSDTDWTLWDTTGAVCTTTAAEFQFVTIEFPSAEIVPAGSTYRYSLKIDTTGASSSSDDAIRVDIVGDPTMSSFLATSTANDVNDTVIGPAVAYDAVAVDNAISVDVGTEFFMGDVLCFDLATEGTCATTEEKMLLVSCTETAASGNGSNGLLCAGSGATTLTVVRGYMNSPASYDDDTIGTTVVNTAEYMRAPGAFVWQDDGVDAITTAVQERFGAYLVDSLDMTGGTLVF